MNEGAAGNKPGSVKIARLQPERSRNNTIQVLRFIAALMVLLLHSTYYTRDRLDSSAYVFTPGMNGVGLFFTISGFVIFVSSTTIVNKANGWKELR